MGTNPDLIMVWTTQTPAAGIIAALRARGYTGQITASDVISPRSGLQEDRRAARRRAVPDRLRVPRSPKAPRRRSSSRAITKKFGEAPDTYSAQGYTALYYIAQGLKGLEASPPARTSPTRSPRSKSIGLQRLWRRADESTARPKSRTP